MRSPLKGFAAFAAHIARMTGKPFTFAASCLTIVVWAATGPMFHYSDTWQLVINTGTTIVTFLMVFLIQNTQNRDGAAIQAKLDELIRASAAQNHYIGIEHLNEEELVALRLRCATRAGDERLTGALDAADMAEEDFKAKANSAAESAGGLVVHPMGRSSTP